MEPVSRFNAHLDVCRVKLVMVRARTPVMWRLVQMMVRIATARLGVVLRCSTTTSAMRFARSRRVTTITRIAMRSAAQAAFEARSTTGPVSLSVTLLLVRTMVMTVRITVRQPAALQDTATMASAKRFAISRSATLTTQTAASCQRHSSYTSYASLLMKTRTLTRRTRALSLAWGLVCFSSSLV
jgi:hypothetical protein